MEITELLKDAAKNVKDILDVNTVIGEPILSSDITVIPISKMSVGFVSGGLEIEGKNAQKNKDFPAGGVGGGANIVPIGFLVFDGINVKFLKTEGVEKWNDCIDNILEFISRK